MVRMPEEESKNPLTRLAEEIKKKKTVTMMRKTHSPKQQN